MPTATPSHHGPRHKSLLNALRAALGLPPTSGVLGDHDHDQVRELLPDWAIEVRESPCPRLRGWWQCALDRAANHGERPLLLYHINDQPWRAILAVRDLSPTLATTAPQLHVEMDLHTLAAVIHAQHSHPSRLRASETQPPRGSVRRGENRFPRPSALGLCPASRGASGSARCAGAGVDDETGAMASEATV